MVVARLLSRLSKVHGGFKVLAIHVDYANRAESVLEAGFIRDWCVGEEIEFKMKRIEDLTRGITAREVL